MRTDRAPLLLGAAAGMEVCWRSAWACYGALALFSRAFPLPLAAGVFLAGLAVTSASRLRGWRIIQLLGLQAVGLAAAALLFLYDLERPASPWYRIHWLGALWSRPREVKEWLELAVTLFWSAVFWASGAFLARRPLVYLRVCTRFDVGVAAFFALFIVRWLVRANGGPELAGPEGEWLLASFFTFALFAVGLARLRGAGETRFAAGRRGLGALLGVAVSVVCLGTASTLFFLPYLATAAATGYGALRTVGGPASALFLQLLAFLFTGRRAPSAAAGGAAAQGLQLRWAPGTSSGGGAWDAFVQATLQWGIGAVLVVALGVVVGVGAWKLVRWLLSRTSLPEVGASEGIRRFSWKAFALFLLRLAGRFLPRQQGRLTASGLYAELRAWGLRGGVAASVSETPLEYGGRLSRQFPVARREIDLIVDLHVQEVYGGRTFGGTQLATAARARGRLSSPLLWPQRLRSWLSPNPRSKAGALD